MLTYKNSYHLYCGQACFDIHMQYVDKWFIDKWLMVATIWLRHFRDYKADKCIREKGTIDSISYQQYPDERGSRGNNDSISTYAGTFGSIAGSKAKREHLLKQKYAVIN